MTGILGEINYLAVFLGGVLYMTVCSVWYGPLFGKAWLQEMGMTEEEVKASGNPTGAMIKSFISAIIMSFGMAFLFAHPGLPVGTALHGAGVGAFLGLIIVGGVTYPNYAFESKSLKHFLIHIGASTLSMALIGALLASW